MRLPDQLIGKEEEVARFVFEKTYYRADGTAKAKAFYRDNEGVCSVFRSSGLTHPQVVALGNQYVAPLRNKPLLGHIPRTAGDVRRAGLDVRSAPPPDRHAEIFGYPADYHLMMERAQELAATARFVAAP